MRSLGDDIVEVPVDTAADAQALAQRLRQQSSFLQVISGLSSVAVQYDPLEISRADAATIVQNTLLSKRAPASDVATEMQISIHYDGPELAAVCEMLSLSSEAFIEAHTAVVHTVDMLGFTPGFAYLSSMGKSYEVERLPSPRRLVDAGSIGFAGGRTGLYGLAGPGGWPLIGRTSGKLFDVEAKDPFLIQAGMPIRFVHAQ